jgi:hypothetical protein
MLCVIRRCAPPEVVPSSELVPPSEFEAGFQPNDRGLKPNRQGPKAALLLSLLCTPSSGLKSSREGSGVTHFDAGWWAPVTPHRDESDANDYSSTTLRLLICPRLFCLPTFRMILPGPQVLPSCVVPRDLVEPQTVNIVTESWIATVKRTQRSLPDLHMVSVGGGAQPSHLDLLHPKTASVRALTSVLRIEC